MASAFGDAGDAQETYNPFAGSMAPKGARIKKNPTEEPCWNYPVVDDDGDYTIQ